MLKRLAIILGILISVQGIAQVKSNGNKANKDKVIKTLNIIYNTAESEDLSKIKSENPDKIVIGNFKKNSSLYNNEFDYLELSKISDKEFNLIISDYLGNIIISYNGVYPNARMHLNNMEDGIYYLKIVSEDKTELYEIEKS